MRILVVAEQDGTAVRLASRSALTFARSCAAATDGRVQWLMLGHQLDMPAADAAAFAPVLVADNPALLHPLADRFAHLIAAAVRHCQADLLVAAAGTWAKDIVTRAAGLLGGAMAGDVVAHEFHEGRFYLQRPMYAGAVLATVELCGAPTRAFSTETVGIAPGQYARRRLPSCGHRSSRSCLCDGQRDDGDSPAGVEIRRRRGPVPCSRRGLM